MGYSFYIARKLSLGSEGRKSSPAVKVAIAAVAISIAVMTASIAIVLGFRNEITNRITGFNSHITVYSTADDGAKTNIVSLDKGLEQILDSQPFITSYSLEASMPAILKTDTDFKGVYMRGYGRGADTVFLQSNLVDGRLPNFAKRTEEPEVIISQTAASQLNLKTGQTVDTYFISDDVRVRRMRITGIFNSHFDQYDNILIYGQMWLLQELGSINPDEGTSIRVMTDRFDELDANTDRLRTVLAKSLTDGRLRKFHQAENVLYQGANYFQWLELLDTNVVVILVLMTLVACVTLVSGMLIIIVDKMRFIGIVKSLGMPNGALRRVFVWMSLKVAIGGMLIGDAIMVGLLALQKATHAIPLDPDAYYFDYVPVELNWGAFGILNAGVLLVIFLMLLLPSQFAAKISPAKTMRFE